MTSRTTWTRLLLDRHTLLWSLREPAHIPAEPLEIIGSPKTEVFVSMASLWEIAIKVSLGKLILPGSFEDLFPESVTASGIQLLPILTFHLCELQYLPPHHRDPFDRLLIAQAKAEGLTIVTSDPHFAAYGVPLLW